ncbi:MAG: Hsp20/alpha crystallin family protein [Gammaproteobacteria bacterium]|nr:Hsp20/alpha crystallin family protein [Gammaproteobacteria bacterium]MDH3428694.1 Hsp20/alpha crystallin family protein [Gammaproteobacteria bacterium]MDH3433859.1 Hsp20/alpha crystallin family protein [Gammaproteobacteria bacterium]
MNLVHFNPWSLADLMHRDLDRLAPRRVARGDVESPLADWVPAVDIVEEKDRFVLRADVPGVATDDIEVSMEDGVLSVSGRRDAETADETDGVRRFERVTGRFYRRFSLPDTADAEGIAAKSANGVLEISIPKLPEIQPRRIKIEAA